MQVNRTTAIVGAGAVLDFDFSYDGAVYPSTSEITRIVSKIKVQGLDVEESDIITAVYSHANKVLNDIYRKRNLKNIHYEISRDAADNFVFTGSGYGHNLGMSQWGAYAMAKYYEKDYRFILGFYYTGVGLSCGVIE